MIFDLSPDRGGSPAAPPHPVTEATVQTGHIETRYRRCGSGAAVLLLVADHGDGAPGDELLAWLAEHFRVIVPRLPAGVARAADAGLPPTSVTAWLRDVIDGLGLVRPAIVADEPYALAALHFSATDPERTGGLVALYRDFADPTVLPSPVPDPSHPGRVLLLRIGPHGLRDCDAPALADAVRFLGAER